MKHFIAIISGLLLSMSASATVYLKDITPDRFKFGNYSTSTSFAWDETTVGGPNHRVPAAINAIPSNGLACAYFNVKVPDTEIVKHSDEAGTALKIYQGSSNVGFGVLEFYPPQASTYMRATMIYRIEGTYTGSGSHAISVLPYNPAINGFSTSTAYHTTNSSNELIKADSSTDPTQWVKTTVDFKKATGTEYQVQFNLNQGATIYIKEVRFEEITCNNESELNTAGTTEWVDITTLSWGSDWKDVTFASAITPNAFNFADYSDSFAYTATVKGSNVSGYNAGSIVLSSSDDQTLTDVAANSYISQYPGLGNMLEVHSTASAQDAAIRFFAGDSNLSGYTRARLTFRLEDEGSWVSARSASTLDVNFAGTSATPATVSLDADQLHSAAYTDGEFNNTWQTVTLDVEGLNSIELNLNDILAKGGTLYVKEIELTPIESFSHPEQLLTSTANAASTAEYTPATTTGIDSVNTNSNVATFSINGNEVTFSADAEIFSISGAKAATAKAGQSVTLNGGFYVARTINGTSSKFIIK
jgi:hypothetical protein